MSARAAFILCLLCAAGKATLSSQTVEIRSDPGLAPETLVIDVPHDAPRWMKFAAGALQGLANRTKGTVYLLWGEREAPDRYSHTEQVWLDRYTAMDGLKLNHRPIADLPSLATGDLKPAVRGLLIYPDDVIDGAAWSPLLHVYLYLASIDDLLPVPLSKRALFPTLEVIRDANAAAWGHDPSAGYRFIYDHYRSELADARSLAHNHPSVLRMVDYCVANRILPLFYWKGIPSETQELFAQILKESGPVKDVIGCWSIPRWNIPDFEELNNPPGEEHVVAPSVLNIQDEHEYVRLLNSFGKRVLVTSEMGIGNLSFTQRMTCASKPWKSEFETVALDASKVYVAFTLTDGDNLSFWTNQGGFVDQVLDQKSHDLPMQWSFNIALVDLVPGLVDYLESKASHVNSFATGLSGYGYVMTKDFASRYPERREALLRQHFAASAQVMQRLGQRSVWWWYDYDDNKLGPGSGLEEAQWFVDEATHRFTPLGLFNGYGRGGNYTPATANGLVGGVPRFSNLHGDIPADIAADAGARLIAEHISTIAKGLPRPFFINFTLHPNQSRGIVGVMQLLGGDYIAVNGDALGNLYRQAAKAGK